jgi:hypothetical protein
MAEKPAKKAVSVAIKRDRPTAPRVVVATGFRLKPEKETGLVDILLQVTGQRGERVSFDPLVIRTNLDMLKRYAVGLSVDADDNAQKDEVSAGELHTFANMVHFSHMGPRAETVFGVFSIADWVEATRQGKAEVPEIKSYDMLVTISTAAFQKKLLLELVLLLSQQEKK